MRSELADWAPREVRELIRRGVFKDRTAGCALPYLQANLAIVPEADAPAFREFCEASYKACPLIEVGRPGDPEARITAPGSDIRTDLGLYRVFRKGTLAEETDSLLDLWTDDLVFFLFGCSFTFDVVFANAGLDYLRARLDRHIPAYVTSVQCGSGGRFSGPMVASMRQVLPTHLETVEMLTAELEIAHGAPVAVGDPGAVGIGDLLQPDYGDPPILIGELVPVFWACGITPQEIAKRAKTEILITHARGRMFVTDVPVESVRGATLQEWWSLRG